MSNYTPDCWRAIKLTGKAVGKKPLYKILAGWRSTYLSGESWQINSGIVKIEDKKDYYDVHGISGSIYRCYKDSEDTSSYMLEIFDRYAKQLAEHSVELEMLDIADILKKFK